MTSSIKEIKLLLFNYPNASQSALYGLLEMFVLTNAICENQGLAQRFQTDMLEMNQIHGLKKVSNRYAVMIIPPSIEGEYYLSPDQETQEWLRQLYNSGTLLCSVCAGTFILAATGLLKGRKATTHWGLESAFLERFPEVILNIDKILINDGDIITAGGLMSWADLGLELVSQFVNPQVMRQLGKQLIVDTGLREQSYYQNFMPIREHGDEIILKVQNHLQIYYHEPIKVEALAQLSFLTQRTFLRRFVKATGLRPIQYLQKLRVQKACELIESTQDSVELIAQQVGYEDSSSFRKVFIRLMGLTPREFKKRFAGR